MTRVSRTLVTVSVVVIVWFLPRESGPQFRYDVGKPWMYGSLIATFDFSISDACPAISLCLCLYYTMPRVIYATKIIFPQPVYS